MSVAAQGLALAGVELSRLPFFSVASKVVSLSLSLSLSAFPARDTIQERKFSPKRKFWAGHPCGRPAKNFGQALQILEKQAFRNGHPTRTSMKKLRSEKLRAAFSFPNHRDPKTMGEAFLLTVGASLLTVELLCLQSLKALIRCTFLL